MRNRELRGRVAFTSVKGAMVITSVAIVTLDASAALGSGWDVDTNSMFNVTGEVFADGAYALPFPPPPVPLEQPVWMPYSMMCPAWLIPPGPPVPGSTWDYEILNETQLFGNFPDINGVIHELGGGLVNLGVTDPDPPLPGEPLADSDITASVTINGLNDRQLQVRFNAFASGFAFSEGYFTRGCALLNTTLNAKADDLKDNEEVFIRIDIEHQFDGRARHECILPDLRCTPPTGVGPFEDPQAVTGFLNLDIDQTSIGVVPATAIDSDLGSGIITPLTFDSSAILLTASNGEIPVDIEGNATARSQMAYFGDSFGGLGDMEVGSVWMALDLHIIPRYFDVDTNYFRLVPAGGPGPQYAYRAGQFEITNGQYADFLNLAHWDAGMTDVGTNMFFAIDGQVHTTGGDVMFQPQGVFADSRIIYTPSAPVGTRYTPEFRYTNQPVVGVTWIGAVKFCNWLTLEQGLGSSQRCYTEGADIGDWRPATISKADWIVRDLNAGERQQLAEQYRGFRLPMDGLVSATGHIDNQEGSYNEWYKMAAYDPNGPVTTRTDSGGADISPLHWIFGFGRDAITLRDANYFSSGDPYDDDDAPVGFFDGVNILGDGVTVTTDTANPYVIYDLSGNIIEWAQDQVAAPDERAVRGGSWQQGATEQAASYRESHSQSDIDAAVGFRVIRAGYCRIDLNADDVVDADDLTILVNCVSGPDVQVAAVCLVADLDLDLDVDLADFALWQGFNCP